MSAGNFVERARASIKDQGFTTLVSEPEAGVYLFFSFDLVNSTQFKSAQPKIWPLAITRFYELIVSEMITRIAGATVWKFVGDEVLLMKRVSADQDIFESLPAASDALRVTTEQLFKNYAGARVSGRSN
jgi:hypothetical protein